MKAEEYLNAPSAEAFLNAPSAEEFLASEQSFLADAANRFRKAGAEAMGKTIQAVPRIGYILGRAVGIEPDMPPELHEQRLKEESPMYRMGEALVEGAQEAFPTDPVRDPSFASTLIGSAGAMIPTIATGVAGRTAAAIQYGLTAGETAAEEALAAGRPDAADAAFLANAPIGAVTEAALGVAPRFIPGLRAGAGRQAVASALARGAARESIQEGMEQVGSNLIASRVAGYDPDRPTTEGVLTAMIAGAALGGPINAAGAALGNLAQEQRSAVAQPRPVESEPELSEFGGLTEADVEVLPTHQPDLQVAQTSQDLKEQAPRLQPEAQDLQPPTTKLQPETPGVQPASAPQPDFIESALSRAIDGLETKPGQLYSDPLLIQAVGRPALRGALIAVRAAYRASKSVARAIEAGIDWLRKQGKPFDEDRFRSWAAAELAPPQPSAQPAAPPSPPSPAAQTPTSAPAGTAPAPPSVLGPGERERKLSPRLQQADWLTPEVRQRIRNRTYQQRAMAASEAVAAELVQELGPEAADRLALDLTVDIPMDVRGGLTAVVAQEYSRRERTATTPQEAQAWRDRNADYLSRLLPFTTDMGRFINMLRAFSWQSADGAVMTAQRILDQATEEHMATYRTLLDQAREVIRAAHDVAITDTVNAPVIQRAAAAAVDEAVIRDDEIRRIIRGRAAEDLEPDVRKAAAEAKLDPDRVATTVNEHWGPSPSPNILRDKLAAAGVPPDLAETWARRWNKAFVDTVGELEWKVRQTLTSERTRALRLRRLRGVWTLEREAAAQALLRSMGAKGSKEQHGAVAELARRVASRLRQQMGTKSTRAAGLTDLALLREAANNFSRYQEVWAEAWNQARAEGMKDIAEALEAGQPQPFADARVDRVIRGKLRAWNLKMGDAVRRSRAAQTGTLGDVLVGEAGLNGDAAQKLRDAINQRWDAVSADRKRREIEKLLRDQPDEGKVPQLKTVLRKFAALHDLGAMDDAQWLREIRSALGLGPLNAEQLSKLRRLADAIAAIPADQQFRRQEATIKLLSELDKIRKPLRWHEFPMAIWYAHILSGWRTHMVNALSNAINLAGSLTAQTLRNPASLADTVRAVGRGVVRAWPEAIQALATGAVTGPRLGTKFNDPGFFEKVDSKWLLPWAMVGRALAAADLMFFHPASEARQALMARAIARREGLSGRALHQRMQDLLANGDQTRINAATQATREGFTGRQHRRRVAEIIQAQRDAQGDFSRTGREFGLATTFNNEPYGVLGAVAQLINSFSRGHPWARLVVPFTNIIANVVNESINYTPVGSIRALYTAKPYGKQIDRSDWADQQMLADLHAKAAIGTILLIGIAMRAAAHMDDDDPPFAVTGQGPKDKGRRDTLRASGWIPNSIKVGDRYFSYQQTPAAVPLAVLGNYMDALRYGKLDQGDALDRVAYVLSMTGKTIVQQSFLDSIARLSGSIERPSETKSGDALADWASRTGASFVAPNLLRQIDSTFDSKVYAAEDVRGMVLSQLPFARRQLRPVLNGLGEAIEKPWMERFTNQATPDPVWRELARLNVGVYPAALEFQGRALTNDEVYDVVRIAGPVIRQRVTRLMAAPGYARMNDERRADRIGDIIRQARASAKRQVMTSRAASAAAQAGQPPQTILDQLASQ